jgi:hypothetical protein
LRNPLLKPPLLPLLLPGSPASAPKSVLPLLLAGPGSTAVAALVAVLLARERVRAAHAPKLQTPDAPNTTAAGPAEWPTPPASKRRRSAEV